MSPGSVGALMFGLPGATLPGEISRCASTGDGNTKSAAFLLNRHDAMTSGEPMESGLGEDDEAVLEAYLQKYQSKLNPKEE